MQKAAAFSLISSAFLSLTTFSTASASPERIAEIKSEIRKIALENLGRRDNLAETRSQLEPLVQEISQFHSPAAAQDDVALLEGAWKELFSDDVEPEPPGFRTDRDSVYQVITTQGYFYNLANLKGPISVLGILRGAYTPAEDYLNIEFTKVSIRPQALRENENLVELVSQIEPGSTFTVVPPGNNKAPNGPVGAKGNIRNLYIDGDFRVATGSNFADGKMDIYILDKVTKPVRYNP
jgi:hypothetical protein